MKIRSHPSAFGGSDFYDEDGNKIGHSVPNVFGGETFYDSDGNCTGSSFRNMFGGSVYQNEDDDDDDWEPRRSRKVEVEHLSAEMRKRIESENW